MSIFSRLNLILAMLLVTTSALTGCRSTTSRFAQNSLAEHNTTVKVTPWLAASKHVPVEKDTKLINLVGKLFSQSEYQDLTKNLLNKIRKSPVGRSNTNIGDIAEFLQKDASLIKVTRGNQDWLIPVSLVLLPAVADMAIKQGDKIETVPLDSTSFHLNQTSANQTKPETLSVLVAGPLAKKSGLQTFGIESGRDSSIGIKQMIDTRGNVFSNVEGDLVFLSTDENSFGDPRFADLIVISRRDPISGRRQSLTLPAAPLNSDKSDDNALNPIIRQAIKDAALKDPDVKAIEDGDVIEITRLDVYFTELK